MLLLPKKMKILICALGIVLCALSTSAFPKPKQDVPPHCIDPTFACQDLESARLCGAVKDCIHDVWATMSAPDDNDEICDICKEMVKEARDQLLSNMTQEEIKEVFEGSCKLLPVKLVADACIKVVDEIIPELVEMLASRMDPNMVCTVSGMCNPIDSARENDVGKFFKMILDQRRENQCSECTTMITDVQTFLKSTPESEVKKYLENFCDEKVPSYLCDILINSYLPTMYTYIVKTDAKTLCSSVGICPKVCKLEDTQQVNDELTCEFCEHVLQHVKDLVTANTTAEEFRTALLNFCKHMGSFSEKCTAIVNDYYDMLFDYIRKLDTKGMCTLIGLCDNEKCSEMPLLKLIPATEAKKRISMIKLQPANRISTSEHVQPLIRLIPAEVASKRKTDETNDIFPSQLPLEKFTHPLSIFKQDTECAFCKAISFYLEKDLNGDTSKEGVQKALDNVCEKWVIDFPQHCRNFLDKYSEKILHALVEGVKLEEMCIFSKACIADDKHSEIKVTVMAKAGEGPFCDLCKETMNEVENVLSDPATKQKVEDLMDQGCNVLPQSLRDDCTNFVNSNVEALIDILQQELQPDNFCPALRLCNEKERLRVPARVKDVECDLCKDVISSLRQKLSDPAEKQNLLTFLEEGCAKLPESLAQGCKTFVDENIDTIIGMIIEQLDPDSVCGILKLCSAPPKKEKKLNSIECDLCKEVVGKVEEMVKDRKTEDEIKGALEKVCSYLPKSYSVKCKNFVDQYTEMLITLLMEEMDPDMICAALNICPANVQYPAWQSKEKDVECQGCQYALHYLQEQLTNTDTQEEIKNVLKKMCDVLPETYAKNCEGFVDEYGSSLLVLISQEIDPSVLCYELQLCLNQTKMFEKHAGILHPFKTDECSICTTVVDYVDKLLEEDDVDKEITSLVEKVCTVLPASYKQKCSTMLETYGPYILQMIGQVADSKEVCQEIDLCARPAGHVHLLGGNKCTFGPSYWCKSNAHASACKAEGYCKERVWKN